MRTERTRQDKEEDKNKAPQGAMKGTRGERETSEAFKRRRGVTPEIQTAKPKNVRNERDKERMSVARFIFTLSQKQTSGKNLWLCTFLVFNSSQAMTSFFIS